MTAKQTVPEVTVDGILKALSDGAKSLTGIAKMLGYKSGSSATLKRIAQVVPDIMDRLAINTPKDIPNKDTPKAGKGGKKTTKVPAVKKSAGTVAYPIPDITPFRHNPEKPSGYSMVWAILYAHRQTGINKNDLVAKYKAWSKKPEQNCLWDVHVVCSRPPRSKLSLKRQRVR